MNDDGRRNGTGVQAYRETEARFARDLRDAEAKVQRLHIALDAVRALIAGDTDGGQLALTVESSAIGSSVSMVTLSTPLHIPRHAKMREAVLAVLQHEGRPMSVRDIFEVALRSGWGYSNKFESFRGGCFPMLRRDEAFFEKVDAGRYRARSQNGQK